jgi:hypothetical protein
MTNKMANTNEIKLIGRWMENYMSHESSPLSNMKMPKPHPIIYFMNRTFNGSPKGVSPTSE